tara:strand:- start:1406 stop:1906 length:501 start_codon:yes stop_codon:yes gene_type:complete
MRDFKSIGFNFVPVLLLVAFLYATTERLSDFNFILRFKYIIISASILILLFSVNIVKVNNQGITKSLLGLIKIKQKTWREIKFYAEVDEIYRGQYGNTITPALWFIDKNDKVCLRVQIKFRKNLNEVLRIIDKFEDKFEKKLSIKSPYFMKNGWTKVNYDNIKIKT